MTSKGNCSIEKLKQDLAKSQKKNIQLVNQVEELQSTLKQYKRLVNQKIASINEEWKSDKARWEKLQQEAQEQLKEKLYSSKQEQEILERENALLKQQV